MSRDRHVEDVANGAAKAIPATAAEGPGAVAACDANCEPLRLRARPYRPARSCTKRQSPLPPLRLQRVLRNVRQFSKLARGTRPRKKKAAELLLLADQRRLYRDLPHMIGRDRVKLAEAVERLGLEIAGALRR